MPWNKFFLGLVLKYYFPTLNNNYVSLLFCFYLLFNFINMCLECITIIINTESWYMYITHLNTFSPISFPSSSYLSLHHLVPFPLANYLPPCFILLYNLSFVILNASYTFIDSSLMTM